MLIVKQPPDRETLIVRLWPTGRPLKPTVYASSLSTTQHPLSILPFVVPAGLAKSPHPRLRDLNLMRTSAFLNSAAPS